MPELTPSLLIQPTTEALGSMGVGTTSTLTFNFVNIAPGGGSIEVSSILVSEDNGKTGATLVCQKSTPFVVFNNVSVKFTLSITAADSYSFTIKVYNNYDPNEIDLKVTVSASGSGPAATAVSLDPDLDVGVMYNTLVNHTSTTSVGLKNTGNASFNITSATITLGADVDAGVYTQYPAITLPLTVAVGATGWIPILFAPDVAGTATATLTIRTNITGLTSITVPLTGIATDFTPVNILTGSATKTLLGFYSTDGNDFIKSVTDGSYNYSDADSVAVFNGSLWNMPGYEKTLQRLEVYYENLGVCSSLIFTLKILRPSISSDYQDIIMKTITIGTAAADNSFRAAFVDLTVSGEIIELTITRTKNSGPVALVGLIPHFAPRGEKVEGE